jgi:hypothetical protein
MFQGNGKPPGINSLFITPEMQNINEKIPWAILFEGK